MVVGLRKLRRFLCNFFGQALALGGLLTSFGEVFVTEVERLFDFTLRLLQIFLGVVEFGLSASILGVDAFDPAKLTSEDLEIGD